MMVFLEPTLAAHRRGRVLESLLQAQRRGETLPDEGILLMTGKEMQTSGDADRAALTSWCAGPGRILLLLPPYSEGQVLGSLDWTIGFRDAAAEPVGQRVPDLLAEETTYLLQGSDGDFDREAGHQWPDYSVNTRFIKAHSGSGLFAATCLPLWSITLLNESKALDVWLSALRGQAGCAAESKVMAAVVGGPESLTAEALGVLVCLFGWQTGDPDVIFSALEAQPVPLFQLDRARVAALIPGLKARGYLDEAGLTTAGIAALRASAYWEYGVRLKEELA